MIIVIDVPDMKLIFPPSLKYIQLFVLCQKNKCLSSTFTENCLLVHYG